MATRSIVTSQPDVECDVCERRLLRGEQHDVFLAAGRRRTVCELCAPRAVHEGWRREADHASLTLPPMRPRRGRNFFERLRSVARPAESREKEAAADLDYAHELPPYEPLEESEQREPLPYDFLDGLDPSADPDPASGTARSKEHTSQPAPARLPAAGPTPAVRAIAVFNASEYPRRISGIARSLGAPAVHVRQEEDAVGEVVAIVVAWELCWYRYEVDLDEPTPTAGLAAQGTELEELPRGDRIANTQADELGAVSAAAL
jgi:hypothetical protein